MSSTAKAGYCARIIRQLGVSCSKLCYETVGTTSVEYAVILMLVMITVLYGVDYLSDSVHQSFENVTTSIEKPESTDITGTDVAFPSSETTSATGSAPSRGMVMRTARLAVLVISSALLVILLRRIWNKSAQVQFDQRLSRQTNELPADVIFEKRHRILDVLFRELGSENAFQLRIGQVMTQKIRSVLPTTPIDELKQIICEHRLRHLIVCDKAGELLGVISDRDLLGRDGKYARDYMTYPAITVQRDDLLDPAVTLLIQKRISCLPVIFNGHLCGLLTSTDVMMALQCMSQAMQRSSHQEHPDDLTATLKIAVTEAQMNRDLPAVAMSDC